MTNTKEKFLEGEHVSIEDLKSRPDIRDAIHFQRYLSKEIQKYPTPVEFQISEVSHVTNKTSLPQIWNSGGFRGFGKEPLSWWSLKINEADVRAAEEHYLKSKELSAPQQSFLRTFTTSPAFNNDTSRYGNFRFTFPLTELMEAYKQQICNGQEPVLRIYGTKLFRQEIEYVVLVHSPEFNETYSKFPMLTSRPLVAYEANEIIWSAQAICETHNFQMVINGKTAETKPLDSHEFYVWDHVSLAFHIKDILSFPKRRLKESLSSCELSNINLSKGENCSSIEEADNFIRGLPDE